MMFGLFRLSGRMNRFPYFMWTVFLNTLFPIIGILIVLSILAVVSDNSNSEDLEITISVLGGVFVFVLCAIAQLAITVRRLHDIDIHGIVAFLLFTGIGILMIFILWFIPGTRGNNKYGPDPLLKKE